MLERYSRFVIFFRDFWLVDDVLKRDVILGHKDTHVIFFVCFQRLLDEAH